MGPRETANTSDRLTTSFGEEFLFTDTAADTGGELVHTSTTEGTTIMSDHEKLPDDYDPELGDPLYEVYGNE